MTRQSEEQRLSLGAPLDTHVDYKAGLVRLSLKRTLLNFLSTIRLASRALVMFLPIAFHLTVVRLY